MRRKIDIVTVLFSVFLLFHSCSPARKVTAEIPTKNSVPVTKPPITNTNPTPAVVSPTSKTALNNNAEIFTSFSNIFPTTIKNVIDKKEENRVQIIYTEINRDKNNVPHFTPHYFNVEPQSFFPAGTTVSLPLAFLAFQKTNELKIEGVSLYTTMITEAAGKNLQGTYNDPYSANGKPTISGYLKRLLLANDTVAFNRLYEFLGQQYIASNLKQNGLSGTEIIGRLWGDYSKTENAVTNPVVFYNDGGRELYRQNLMANVSKYVAENKNTAGDYFVSNKIADSKIDLSTVNKTSLPVLESLMRRLFFLGEQAGSSYFKILPADRTFLQAWLGLLPRQSKFPAYGNERSDAFDKYLYYGADNGRKDPRFKVYNISGKEYGQMTDVAYVADLDRKVEFLLAATIYCGEKSNDGEVVYNYNTVGLPFMRDLGIAVYRYELLRKKNFLPDFSELPLAE